VTLPENGNMSQESAGPLTDRPPSTDSSRSGGVRGSDFSAKNTDDLRPTTNHESKMVVLSAERGDQVTIGQIVEKFHDSVTLPDSVTVVKRSSTYYGPKLQVHAEIEGDNYNFLINAPGPASELMLWCAETDEDNTRSNWYRLAEVYARLAEDQPAFEICPQCKSPIRSVEHERQASLGNCDN